MPQIIFVISNLSKEPSPDYVIVVTQLLAYLIPCIMLSCLDPTIHHYPLLCFSLSIDYFVLLSTMRSTC